MTDITILHKSEQNTSAWSGGVTKQLGIWPQGADYKTRNFGWRISTALVELDESVFTALPGVSRWLMMLDGQIHLVHEGIRELDMKPFDPVASFDGGWTTRSSGRCRDFNLMTKAGCTGGLGYVPLGAASFKVFEGCGGEAWETFYCLVPKLELVFEGKNISLVQSDFLSLHADGKRAAADLQVVGEYETIPAARAFVRRTEA